MLEVPSLILRKVVAYMYIKFILKFEIALSHTIFMSIAINTKDFDNTILLYTVHIGVQCKTLRKQLEYSALLNIALT